MTLGLRPFWNYYGGKWRMAPKYMYPGYDTIIEPFAGAAGYSLRHFERKVILVEKYPVVAEVWRWLIGASSRDVLSVPLVEHVDDLPASTPLGARHLVGFRLNNGSAQPKRQLSSGMRKLAACGRSCGWTECTRRQVASQVERIKHWTIIEGDYTAAPDMRCTHFVDGPYNNKAGESYIHGPRDIDFAHLAAWCRYRRGEIIVCENEGADWLPFRPLHTSKAGPRSNGSREVLWGTCYGAA